MTTPPSGELLELSPRRRQVRPASPPKRRGTDGSSGKGRSYCRRMPRRGSPYGPAYDRARRVLLAGRPMCVHCRRRLATEADHQPPLTLHVHRNGAGCCRLVPACGPCQREQAGRLAHGGEDVAAVVVGELVSDEVGLPVGVFEVEWLEDLLDVPGDAVWPRLLSAPHHTAVGSFGVEFEVWCREAYGFELRWFQRLVARRLLEHDALYRLCWQVALLTVARQVGKTAFAHMLLDWRSEQGDRFGEHQLVLHTANVMRSAVRGLDAASDRAYLNGWKRRYAAGNEGIDKGEMGEWLVKSHRSVVGFTASLAYVDEAFAVKLTHVQQNLAPTTVEAESGQLLLASTAHPDCTELVPTYRAEAIDELAVGDGTLLLEWSSARDADITSGEAWRAASPHWSPRRERTIAQAVRRALPYVDAGPGEHELVAGVRCQWLNIWPLHGGVEARGDPLLPLGAWTRRRVELPTDDGPAFIALVDNHGEGCAVAVIVPHVELGVLEAGGWLCEAWDEAWAKAAAVTSVHPRSQVIVGDGAAPDAGHMKAGTRFTDPPKNATRTGLALLRSHVSSGRLVHDRDTDDLDAQVDAARVVATDTGLSLVRAQGRRTDLLRGVCWCLVEAERPHPVAAIH